MYEINIKYDQFYDFKNMIGANSQISYNFRGGKSLNMTIEMITKKEFQTAENLQLEMTQFLKGRT